MKPNTTHDVAVNGLTQPRQLAETIAEIRELLTEHPHDDGLREILLRARAEVSLPPSGDLHDACAVPIDEGFTHRICSAQFYDSVVVIVTIIGCMIIARSWMTRRRGLAVVGMATIAAAMAAFGVRHYEDQSVANAVEPPVAVVGGAGTPLHSGNNSTYPRVFNEPLPAGVEMTVLHQRGDWLQVRLPVGQIGWVERANVVMTRAK